MTYPQVPVQLAPRSLQAVGSAWVRAWKDPTQLPARISEMDDSREILQGGAAFNLIVMRFADWRLTVIWQNLEPRCRRCVPHQPEIRINARHAWL